jgi:predicted ATP-dependent endonuclease of OLD family
MEKVASRGIKIDLHIHSVYSKAKDGQKVEENTLNNVPILVQGLCNNQVEMCAITDHDTFDYDIYSELKKEESKDNCIQKVLPGIEFSVEFIEGKVIHIVTIFDDRDDEKVRNIQNIMINGKGKTCYKKTKEAYMKSDYFDILSEINIDFIMIAHQKKTPSSQHKPHANDVMSLGKEVFNELVFMDYFDAYEFRNKKNEIYNKIYSFENSMEEKLRFLTGSDCHRWKYYPYTEENEKTEFKYTYIKSLPSFKGLAMAVTDHHRIELENSFYNPNEKYVKEVIIEIDGEKNIIPLSKGINVVIGDNSVGKSLFLNAITGNCKKIDRRLYAGYEKYIEKNKLKFGTIISEEDIFRFNQQGEIRSIFDEDGLKPDKYLSNFYPNEINSAKYRSIVDAEIQRMYNAIEKKFSYDDAIKKLPKFQIPTEDTDDKSITFIDNVKKNETKELQMLVDSFEKTIDDMNQLLKSKALMDNDRKHIQTTIEMFLLMSEKYQKVLNEQKLENEKINIFNTYIKNYKTKYSRKITDEQAVFSDYVEQKEVAIESMAEILVAQKELEYFESDISETIVVPESNPVDKYRFISKLQIEKIDNKYVTEVIKSVIKRGKNINTKEITELELKDMIKKYPNEDGVAPFDVLKSKIASRLDADFKVRNTIVEENMDVYEEVSAGFDAQMYFTLLSGEMRDKGIYIIDQPEDHISQKAIKDFVLDQFRRMGQQRQVIMVTHNPQFIVNLDVDNVIYLSKNDGKFTIQSGALEFENEQYSVLRIVADNIEGGLQTIQGRMKRYEKNI